MPLAEINLVQSILLLLAVTIATAWTWTLFLCFADLIRDYELSGLGKAAWALTLLVPIAGCLAYLVARGGEMEVRAIESRRELWK